MQVTFTSLLAASALIASTSAHMILNYPKPYGSPNNSPLENSGADFPCKATGPESYSITEMNEWNAGETKTVSFTGSAVHGGGSCQFSITNSLTPSKDSQWKVIHSIIGGCPSNVTGNLADGSPSSQGAATFDVTMPSDIPAGEWSFAWTWLNKVGNREFYMNCAPIKVGGGGNTASIEEASAALSKLPDMFVANIPNNKDENGCGTTEGEDYVYPNPGESVVYGEAGSPNPGSGLNGPLCAQMTLMGAGGGNIGAPTGSPDAPSPTATQAPSPTAAPSELPSNPGGIFAPSASSAAPPSETAAPTAAPSPSETPAPEPSATEAPTASQPTSVPAPSPSAPTTGESVPCDTDGAIVCIGDSQFGMCDRGLAYPMALAAGTSCSNGVIARRGIRFPRGYLQRRHFTAL